MKFYIKIILIAFLLFPKLVEAQSLPLAKNGIALINVILEGSTPLDTLILLYFKDNLFNEIVQNGDYIELESSVNQGIYKFKLPLSENSGYFFLAIKHKGIFRFDQLTGLLKAEKGDSITLSIKNRDIKNISFIPRYSYSFSGAGNQKYNIRVKTDSIFYWTKSINVPVFSSTFKYNEKNRDRNRINLTLNYLDSNKKDLSTYQVELLKADILFSNSSIFPVIKEKFIKMADNDKDRFRNEYLNTIGRVNIHSFSPRILVDSKSAINYFLSQAAATIFVTGQGDDPEALYHYLCRNYSGVVLDKLLVTYFVKVPLPIAIRSRQLQEVIKKVKTSYCLTKLNQLKIPFQTVGLEKEYNLIDINGKIVSLEDFKGKVTLVDFWFTGCLFCSKFVREQLVKVEEVFKTNPNVVFLSVSIDRDKDRWLNSVIKQEYSLSSSINLYTAGDGSSHPLIKKLNVQGYPSLLILDKRGNIIDFGSAKESVPTLYESIHIIKNIKSHL